MADVTLKGTAELKAKLQRLALRIPDVVGTALFQEAQIEMTEAKRRTPVDTGALRASGMVHQPQMLGRNISVALTFGSVAIGYAVSVHEDLDALHQVGQAKFLESTLNESRAHLPARIARRIMLDRMVA